MKSLILSLFAVFVVHSAHAQWQQTAGPEGGEVRAVIAQGSSLYASTAAGIFKSTDNGHSWIASSNGLPAGPPSSMVCDNTTIYAEIGGYLFTSADGAGTWSKKQDRNDFVSGFTLIAASAGKVYAYEPSNYLGYIVESTDGGNTFTTIYTPAHQYSNDYITNAVPIGAVYDSLFLFADSSRAVYYTVDDGKHWNGMTGALSTGGSLGHLNFLGVQGATLYLTSENGLFALPLKDLSQTWVKASLPAGICYGVAVRGNAMCTFLQHELYGRRAVLYSSSDAGNTWTEQHATDSIQLNSSCATTTGLAVGCGSGVFTSEDDGATWAKHTAGLRAQNVGILRAHNGALYAATRNNSGYTGDASSLSGGIYKSTDDGSTWTQLLGDTIGVKSFDFNGSTMFVRGVATNLPLRYMWLRSSDDGQNWASFGGDSITSYFVAGGSVFGVIASRVTYQTYLARSTDDGSSWNAIGSPKGPYQNSLATSISGMYEAGGNVYADIGLTQQAGGGMYGSNDGGQTWTLLTIPGDYINGLYTSPYVYQVGNSFFLAQGYSSQYIAPKLFVTTDNAATWKLGGSGLPIQQVLAMTEAANTDFAGTGLLGGTFNFGVDSGGVYSSSDGGFTWQNFSDRLPLESVSSLAVVNGKLFAGLWGGSVWYRTVAGAGVDVTERRSAPALLSPNPATTQITLHGVDGITEVRILDAVGREVRSQRIDGTQSTIDLNGLASGVYSAVLVSPEGVTQQVRFSVLH